MTSIWQYIQYFQCSGDLGANIPRLLKTPSPELKMWFKNNPSSPVFYTRKQVMFKNTTEIKTNRIITRF